MHVDATSHVVPRRHTRAPQCMRECARCVRVYCVPFSARCCAHQRTSSRAMPASIHDAGAPPEGPCLPVPLLSTSPVAPTSTCCGSKYPPLVPGAGSRRAARAFAASAACEAVTDTERDDGTAGVDAAAAPVPGVVVLAPPTERSGVGCVLREPSETFPFSPQAVPGVAGGVKSTERRGDAGVACGATVRRSE